MKKIFLNKYFSFLTMLLTACGIYLYACGGDWFFLSYIDETSVFSPEITVDNKKYNPFFYNPYNTFYKDQSLDRGEGKFQESMINDWYNYLGKSVKKETIEYYLFEKAEKEIKSWEKNKKISSEYWLNTKDKQVQNFLDFLVLAKKVEQYSAQSYYYGDWDYEATSENLADADFVKKVEKIYKKTDKKDQFYANRIWFQLLRTMFYSKDRTKIVTFFNETEVEQPKNDLYYRGLDYVAGVMKKAENHEGANLYYIRLFNEYPPLMKTSLRAYRPVSDQRAQNYERMIPYSEREALWALQGYYTRAFEAMQKIYELNPKSKHLDFLLSRYINILESEVNVYNTNYYDSKKHLITRRQYLKDVADKLDTKELDWIFQVTDLNQVSNKYLWNTASGYLQMLKGDFEKSSKYLAKAQKMTKNQAQIDQLRVLNLMKDLSELEKIDLATEEKILKEMQWLKDLAKQQMEHYDGETINGGLRVWYLDAWASQYLSALYKQQKEYIKAELIYPERGYYTDENLMTMEQFLLKKDKSKWEKFLEKQYKFSLKDIYECKAIHSFYQDKVDVAIQELEKYEKMNAKNQNRELELLPGNPFNGKIKDCNDCDHYAYQSVKYTKLEFLQKVKEMQEKINKGQDVYNNALLVGNAFYNASYFGNARFFYHNPIIGEYGNNIDKHNHDRLHSMDKAKKYYAIAKEAASTQEQKAKMAYMMAKIERNEYYNKEYFSKADGYYGYEENVIRPWKGFKELKENYSDTKYYQEVIKECGYFRTYLGIK